eukprot:CAMPEP_0119354050 /NCGR_PEP_ID=MMETSP1334-20130426/3137_1 /TAXON_ID=127549 /ORGANISM="Calcidiscus leptoporus, Strain RCC1130" /LENGTH=205 /DNA_ID=CAMNT_0007367507 /DNA_START=200 /DNA_END=818 /DNA_ORIENTATION=-
MAQLSTAAPINMLSLAEEAAFFHSSCRRRAGGEMGKSHAVSRRQIPLVTPAQAERIAAVAQLRESHFELRAVGVTQCDLDRVHCSDGPLLFDALPLLVHEHASAALEGAAVPVKQLPAALEAHVRAAAVPQVVARHGSRADAIVVDVPKNLVDVALRLVGLERECRVAAQWLHFSALLLLLFPVLCPAASAEARLLRKLALLLLE